MSAQPELKALTASVSRETLDRFELFARLLKKWQGAINLVGPDTLSEAFDRHILDSLQMLNFLPKKNAVLFDLGSGAGFPGLVLAIADPALDVHLVESDIKKCAFLKTVSRETAARITVHNERIENLIGDERLPVPDILTARALAPLPQLLAYSLPWARRNPALTIFAMKGERVDGEIKAAQSSFAFQLVRHPSLTDSKACILEISNLRPLCE